MNEEMKRERLEENRRAGLCPPALHHPPDRKVMHEPTEQKCSGESASSHLESIRCLNKPVKRSLL